MADFITTTSCPIAPLCKFRSAMFGPNGGR